MIDGFYYLFFMYWIYIYFLSFLHTVKEEVCGRTAPFRSGVLMKDVCVNQVCSVSIVIQLGMHKSVFIWLNLEERCFPLSHLLHLNKNFDFIPKSKLNKNREFCVFLLTNILNHVQLMRTFVMVFTHKSTKSNLMMWIGFLCLGLEVE